MPESFFERLLRLRVPLGVMRAHRQAPEAQGGELLAHGPLVHLHPEALADHPLEVHPPPTHHAVGGQVRPCLDDPGQLRLLLGAQPRRWTARPAPIRQPAEPLVVVAVDPVPQRLTVHPARLGRRPAISPLQRHRQRQHPPCRPRVPAPRRRLAKTRSVYLVPRDRNRHHSPSRQQMNGIMARRRVHLTIESANEAAGIRLREPFRRLRRRAILWRTVQGF